MGGGRNVCDLADLELVAVLVPFGLVWDGDEFCELLWERLLAEWALVCE